ncbi:MAG: DUF4390 domain-containing protein [Ahniella sp.]|nr:DUF4390 domain-containing protein [Ahniella sp.]
MFTPLLLALVACGEAPGRLDISRVQLDPGGARVLLDLDLHLSPTHLDALDHGVPLRLDFIVAPLAGAGTVESIVLSFSPLTHQYEMASSQETTPRLFDTRDQMLAALDRISLPVRAVGAPQGFVRARLNLDALPPALRMTARFDRRWQLETRTSAWPP